MSKVYVVIEHFNNAGIDEFNRVVKAFTSKKDAEAFVEAKTNEFYCYLVVETELV